MVKKIAIFFMHITLQIREFVTGRNHAIASISAQVLGNF